MRRYLPELIICLLFAGIVSIHFSVRFSRLVYIAAEKMNSLDDSDDGDGSSVYGDRQEDCQNDPLDDFKCWYPFKDPYAHVSADDHPPFHMIFKGVFVASALLAIGYGLVFRRRHLRGCLRLREFVQLMTRREIFVFWIVLALAAFLRLFHLGSWVVEEAEWGAIENLPLINIIFHGHETRHEPSLYPTLQHFVYMINSTNLAWTRSLTCLTGILLVAGIWRSTRMIFGPRTAMIATFLAAVHPTLISNSHVMRPYSLATFFLVMVLPHAYRLAGRRPSAPGGAAAGRSEPSSRVAGPTANSAASNASCESSFSDVLAFAVFGGLAIWTHYTSLMSLFVLFIYVTGSQLRIRSTAGLMELLKVGIGLLIFFLPFVPYFFSDFSDKQGGLVSNQFVMDMVTSVTGVPLQFGWIPLAFPFVTALRKARSGRFLLYFDIGLMLVVISTVWMIWWEPTHLMIFTPVFVMLMAASAMRLSSRWAPIMLAPYFVVLCVMTGVLFNLPINNLWVWKASRPLLWHGMSYRVSADKALDLMEKSPEKYGCSNVYITPTDQISGFMYYWGPVTPAELGMKPFDGNNFQTFKMDVKVGDSTRTMHLTPMERLWSWEKGQWMDLELALRQQGCLWYQKSYQNCRLGTGRFYSSNDCRWLLQNCETVMSMPDTELFYCERPVEQAPVKKTPPDLYPDENDALRLEP